MTTTTLEKKNCRHYNTYPVFDRARLPNGYINCRDCNNVVECWHAITKLEEINGQTIVVCELCKTRLSKMKGGKNDKVSNN